MALYGEVEVKGDELEVETKLILDRSFGKNLVAFNVVYSLEAEAERENAKNEVKLAQTPVEFDLAYMRNVTTSFGTGIEIVNHNDLVKGSWENSLLYAGPTIIYRGDRWFVIGNYVPQLSNIHKTVDFPKNRDLIEHERAQVRVLIGFSF